MNPNDWVISDASLETTRENVRKAAVAKGHKLARFKGFQFLGPSTLRVAVCQNKGCLARAWVDTGPPMAFRGPALAFRCPTTEPS